MAAAGGGGAASAVEANQRRQEDGAVDGIADKKADGAGALLGALAVVVTGVLAAVARAAEPHPWQIGMQPPATPVKDRLNAFHNELLVIIFLITAFVMALLLYVIVRFNHRRHPVPSRTSHNAGHRNPVDDRAGADPGHHRDPVLQADVLHGPGAEPRHDDQGHRPPMVLVVRISRPGGLAFDSNIIQQADLKPGQLRLLDVDNPLVVPVDTNIRVLVTCTDVIHSWFVPSFGVQEYAVIGRLNESWFNVEREGTYYGECNQICGINHAFMPIEVRAVSKAAFQTWLADAKKKFARNRDTTAPRGAGRRLAGAGRQLRQEGRG